MVEDGESSGPTASKCPVTSDQKLALNLKEDGAIEADAHVGLPEENPQVSVSPPDSQEIHVKIIIFLMLYKFSFSWALKMIT